MSENAKRDWFKWGTAVVLKVNGAKTHAELDAVETKIAGNLLGYEAWDARKAKQLRQYLEIRRRSFEG